MHQTKVHYARDLSRFTEKDSQFISSLPNRNVGVKVGLTAITAFHKMGSVAATIIERMSARNGDVIFDGKFGDIPYQVAGAVKNVCALGVYGLTVRANAEERMLKEAVAARDHAWNVHRGLKKKPLIFGVAVLSSESQDEDATLRYTEKAAKAGFEGMVAPGKMLLSIRSRFPDMLTLNIGIRPEWADWIQSDDQQQTITHTESAAHGATVMAIGRAISHSANPSETIDRIMYELGRPIYRL